MCRLAHLAHGAPFEGERPGIDDRLVADVHRVESLRLAEPGERRRCTNRAEAEIVPVGEPGDLPEKPRYGRCTAHRVPGHQEDSCAHAVARERSPAR